MKIQMVSKTIPALLVLLTVFSSCNNKQKVLFFGDSITYNGTSWEGAYINLIKSYAEADGIRNTEFIGSGIPGNKITDLYIRMDEDVLSQSPDVVVVFVGVNDVWHKFDFGTGTDYNTFGKYYEKLVERLESHGIKVIICTPSCIGEKKDGENPYDEELNKFIDWIRDFAKKQDLPLVDLRSAFLEYNSKFNPDNLEKGILSADGVHLKPEGSKLVADEMWKIIKNEL